MQNYTSRDWFRSEFVKYKQSHPHLGLRTFARKVDIPPGRVSEILSKKRRLTHHLATRLANALEYSPQRKIELFNLIDRESKLVGKKSDEEQRTYEMLSDDEFHLISDWYHYAILNLIGTKDFCADSQWISTRLNVDKVLIEDALSRLFRLELIRQDNGVISRTKKSLSTNTDIPSQALRKFHRQNIEKSLEALEGVPLALRDITSITFPTNLENLPKARLAIKRMRREICKLLEEGPTSEVYNLNIQLSVKTNL